MTRDYWYIWAGIFLVLSLGTLANLWLAREMLAPAPVPQAPPAPTVTTYRDATAAVTCWLAASPHGLGISCLRDAVTPAGVFVP